MGRGQPLPPPGQPLPLPDKKTKTAPIPVPKRKPIPPPNLAPTLPQRPQEGREDSKSQAQYKLPPPTLPKRRRNTKESIQSTSSADDGLLVVEAPATDSDNEHTAYMPRWVEDREEAERDVPSPLTETPDLEPPRLPARRPLHRVLSGSPEEDSHNLPSWIVAQEKEARSRSNFVEEDNAIV